MLILASKSKARKKLLENLGVRFRYTWRVQRKVTDAVRHPARTAAANALLKARAWRGLIRDRFYLILIYLCVTLVWQDGWVFR
jgi:predicted house-cleaning NTP pyrophosphatase (Maf/HAM1 superfamily)